MSNSGVFPSRPDPRVEALMADLAIKYTIEVVNIKDLDLSDHRFQTRTNVSACDSSVVAEYAEEIRHKEPFPMIVVQKRPSGRYSIICGRHRAKAYCKTQNGIAQVHAYVVSAGCNDSDLKSLSVRDNNGNGVRQSTSENVQIAVDHLTAQPLPSGCIAHSNEDINIVARKFKANATTVTSHYRQKIVQAHLQGLGIPLEKFGLNTCRDLWHLLYVNTDNFERIAKALAASNVPNPSKLLITARKERAKPDEIVRRIREYSEPAKQEASFDRRVKDKVTIAIEHLSLALRDIQGLEGNENVDLERIEEIDKLIESISRARVAIGCEL